MLDRKDARVLALKHQFLFDLLPCVVKLGTVIACFGILKSVEHFSVLTFHLLNLSTFEPETPLANVLTDLFSVLRLSHELR